MLQPKILSAEPGHDMTIILHYETGEIKIFDASPYANGTWYGMLKDPDYFKTVHVIPGGIGIEWAQGQDISPHELYDLSHALP